MKLVAHVLIFSVELRGYHPHPELTLIFPFPLERIVRTEKGVVLDVVEIVWLFEGVDVRCVLKPIKYCEPQAFILSLVFRYFSIPIGFGIENLLVLGLLFQVGMGLV